MVLLIGLGERLLLAVAVASACTAAAAAGSATWTAAATTNGPDVDAASFMPTQSYRTTRQAPAKRRARSITRVAWQVPPLLTQPPPSQKQQLVVVDQKPKPSSSSSSSSSSFWSNDKMSLWNANVVVGNDNDADDDNNIQDDFGTTTMALAAAATTTTTTTLAKTTLQEQLAAFPKEGASQADSAGSALKFLVAPPPFVLPFLSGLVTFSALQLYFERPRGRLEVPLSALVVRPSTIGSHAGLGLFATQDLPQDTVLGTYPGVLRRATSWTAVQKASRYPQCLLYHFEFTDEKGWYMDPTNSRGELDNVVGGLLWGGGVPTVLARINEPPLGGSGCNVYCREDVQRREIVFRTSRDVFAGEELFMDYGPKYDRSRYVQQEKQQQQQQTGGEA